MIFKIFIFVICLVISTISNCSFTSVKIANGYLDSAQGVKRVKILIESKKNISESEEKLLLLISRDYISNHKNLIVTSLGVMKNISSQNLCKDVDIRIDGVIYLNLTQYNRKGKFVLELLGKFYNCKEDRLILQSFYRKQFMVNENLNQSLSVVYTTKIDDSVKLKVMPYFRMVKIFTKRLFNPVLSESEEEEKIENDSQFE